MIISRNNNKLSSRRLQVLVLLFAMIVLPIGMVQAKGNRLEKKWAKLQAAVKAGDMSQAYAEAKMTAIKKRTDAKAAQNTKVIAEAKKAATKKKATTKKKAAEAKKVAAKKKAAVHAKTGATPDKAKHNVDLKRIWARLQAAVADGSMSQKEAHAKMAAIKKNVAVHAKTGATKKKAAAKTQTCKAADGKASCDKLPEAIARVAKRIANSGKIVEIEKEKEDGKLIYEIEAIINGQEVDFKFAPNGKLISKEVDDEDDDDGDCDKEKESCDKPKAKKKTDDFDLEKIGQEIRAAVESGKITEKQGWEKWNWVKKNELAPRLQAAVKKGEMSEQDVKNIWMGIRKAEVGHHLKSLVAKGELTEKQALQKWQEFEKGQGKTDYHKTDHPKTDVDWDGIKRRIEGAVKNGSITRKEADAKYREIKARMAHGEKGDGIRARFAAAAARVRAAVKAGDITEAQGRERLAAFRKSLGEKVHGEREKAEGEHGQRDRRERQHREREGEHKKEGEHKRDAHK